MTNQGLRKALRLTAKAITCASVSLCVDLWVFVQGRVIVINSHVSVRDGKLCGTVSIYFFINS